MDLRVRVTRKEELAAGIGLFEFARIGAELLPSFSAGSHIDVHTPAGLIRQYSLCNHPGEQHRYEIAVQLEAAGRGGSQSMLRDVNEGDEVRISLPKNHFALEKSGRDSLLLAGGIGITPLLCMAERLASMGEPFEMHYCTRSPARTAFLQRIRNAAFSSNVSFHFDDGADLPGLDLDALLSTPREGMHIYTCGPKGFMDAVLGTARRHGWSEGQLHYEFFSASPPAATGEVGFQVQLASSGKVYTVEPCQTVVAALAENGVAVPTSCEQGVCGTCLTRVLEGSPDHRDVYLTEAEKEAGDQFLPCCSRSKSARLVLDL